jgi:5-methylcytosine-specific restriction endonuclease McrA
MFTCAQCGQPQSAAGCQADHIVAQADGGSDELSNLQILCATCNTANMHHRATSVAGRTRGAFVARRAGRMGRD